MKIALLALFFLLALSNKPLLGAAGPAPEQVVDTSGKIVRAGYNYYIVPASANEGGLSLASTSENDCPLDVIAVNGYQGLPLVFQPVNVKKGVVRVDTDLNIYFSYYTDCGSTVWKLKDYNYALGQQFVTINGVLGNPGANTIGNWFKIEKYEDAYKLVYCPSVCNGCYYQCSDLGIYEDEWGKRLAFSNVPLKVQFQRA
ncbi:miraculin-like [Arachis stenosperma]|uniref:miraculin-like n=1 Tax=Arachis stenosperma TaxID=217475 RepID=UPI0025AC748B|nr:miraculin-like [Arachis stenosperma]